MESGEIPADRVPFGGHKRAIICKGSADIQSILQAEIAGECIERLPDVQEERGEVLVMGKNPHS